MYRITEPDKFRPSARWIENPLMISSDIRSKQNTTKKELSRGIYKPCLTLSNCIGPSGHRDIMLKVELSLPKLLFGNNFQELRYKDFSLITKKLVEKLECMGVEIDENVLAHAHVSAIHYAKNIVLKDGSTPFHYIRPLLKP
jgi:hypothetical protein